MSWMKVVVSGAGASAIACTRFYITLGVRRENVILVDTKGVVFKGRTEGMNEHKARFAQPTEARTLADAVRDGHVERNVAALARPPRQERGQIAAPETATVRAMLAALAGHRLHDMILVMAATGLRVGEAMGLRWADVTGDTLTVRYQLARHLGLDGGFGERRQ